MGEPIRVVIADDHQLFRRGLHMVLDTEDDIAVVAHASDGREAIEKVSELHPDVVLMDVRMEPGMNGIEATRAIRTDFPETRIVVLTVSDEEDDMFEAVKAGANGYLLKEVSIDEVADAVRAVMSGRSLISPSMAAKLMSEFGAMARRADQSSEEPSPRLTDREHEVLRQVALGRGNEEIAADLGMSEHSVRGHVANILVKLQLRSRIASVLESLDERLHPTGEDQPQPSGRHNGGRG